MEKSTVLGILLDEIPPEGIQLNFENFKEIEDVKLFEPFSVSLHLRKRGYEVIVKGFIKGVITLVCDLCLEEFHYNIEKNFEVLLLPKHSLNFEGERELSSEDLEVSFYENSFINYHDIIHEEILLSLPFRSICREDCKGLCPHCGANLNKETCHCPKIKRTSPFLILKNLKISQEKRVNKEV
ncbi:MAG: YceD family protein [Caldimicrobium sp.]